MGIYSAIIPNHHKVFHIKIVSKVVLKYFPWAYPIYNHLMWNVRWCFSADDLRRYHGIDNFSENVL